MFPPPIAVNFLLKYPSTFHAAFVSLLIFIFMFTFVVAALWVVQTKNLLLGRTTYERFSSLASPAYDNSQGEILTKYTDMIHISNCRFMCCRCELPRQDKLEEFQVRNRGRSSASMLSETSIAGINAVSYHKSLLHEDTGNSTETGPILQDVTVED